MSRYRRGADERSADCALAARSSEAEAAGPQTLNGMSMTTVRRLQDGALNGQSEIVSHAITVLTPSPGHRICERQLTVRSSRPRQQVRPVGQSRGLKQGRSIFSHPSSWNFVGSMQLASGGAFVTQQTWPFSQSWVPQSIGPSLPPSFGGWFG